MGLEGKEIVRMFMLEGTMIGFFGSLVGVMLGSATIYVLTTVGYPLEKIYGDMQVDTSGFPYWGTIYGEWNVPLIIGIFLFGIFIAFLASIYPARKAAKMSVIQAIRFFYGEEIELSHKTCFSKFKPKSTTFPACYHIGYHSPSQCDLFPRVCRRND